MRGYQKRVIYMKNTGSEVFDEAYFIVRDGYTHTSAKVDFLKEANRIVREVSCAENKKKRETGGILPGAVLFGIGFLCAALPAALAFIFV